MPSLASYRSMMERDRKREGLRVGRAAWLIGVTVREYREIEAGERDPDFGHVAAHVRRVLVAVSVHPTTDAPLWPAFMGTLLGALIGGVRRCSPSS